MPFLSGVNTWGLVLLELQPKGLAKANPGLWEGSTKEGVSLHVLVSSENLHPMLSSVLYTLFFLLLDFYTFLENLLQKTASSLFLRTQTLWKSTPNSAFSLREKRHTKTLQKLSEAPWIFWNSCRPPMKIPSNVLQWHWTRKRKQAFRAF